MVLVLVTNVSVDFGTVSSYCHLSFATIPKPDKTVCLRPHSTPDRDRSSGRSGWEDGRTFGLTLRTWVSHAHAARRDVARSGERPTPDRDRSSGRSGMDDGRTFALTLRTPIPPARAARRDVARSGEGPASRVTRGGRFGD